MNIYEKLNEARIRLQSTSLKKSGKNKFSGFSYFELTDFIPSVNKLFNDLKLLSVFSINSDGLAILEIINAENPDEEVSFTSPTAAVDLKGCTAIQGIGATHTYMKRYLYLNALEIVEHDEINARLGDQRDDDYKATVDDVKDVKGLNKVYEFYMGNARDDAWKKYLKNKCEALNAVFNPNSLEFTYRTVDIF